MWCHSSHGAKQGSHLSTAWTLMAKEQSTYLIWMADTSEKYFQTGLTSYGPVLAMSVIVMV
jgi:hypothetical protein